MAVYNRILLKLSGESLMGEKQYGIDEKRLMEYAEQIAEAVSQYLYYPGRNGEAGGKYIIQLLESIHGGRI